MLLRPGSVSAEEITAATGLPVVQPHAGAAIEAPGMMKSHYAPDAVLRLDCTTCEPGAAWLGFGPDDGRASKAARSMNLSRGGDLVEAAANLYAMMKALDGSGAGLICAAPIPAEGLGLAINDRLQRAAAPRN